MERTAKSIQLKKQIIAFIFINLNGNFTITSFFPLIFLLEFYAILIFPPLIYIHIHIYDVIAQQELN